MIKKLQLLAVVLGIVVAAMTIMGAGWGFALRNLHEEFASHGDLDKVYHEIQADQAQSTEDIKSEILYLHESIDSLRDTLLAKPR